MSGGGGGGETVCGMLWVQCVHVHVCPAGSVVIHGRNVSLNTFAIFDCSPKAHHQGIVLFPFSLPIQAQLVLGLESSWQ